MTPTQKALFKVISGPNKNKEIPVHFNPVSLDYTITNTLKEEGEGNSKKQYVSQSSGKLSLSLIFDTTDDGSDVRIVTSQIAQFMQPDEAKAPPIVQFEWGAYSFKGMVEGFKETIDFFAPTGVPLRANVNLTLSQQDVVFEPSSFNSSFDNQASLTPDKVDAPGIGLNLSVLAGQAGNPQAGRAIASLNGQESMRFSSGPVTLSSSIDLKGPSAFSSGGGLGIGLSAGLGVGVSIGSGSGDAFSQLKQSATASVRLDASQLIPPPPTATGRVGAVQVGGQSAGASSGGFSADVGQNADLRARIQFG
ncbi:MAG: hypothetical protein AAGB19_16615 [Cyanobacteria bacterium P01_F01_bin.3]